MWAIKTIIMKEEKKRILTERAQELRRNATPWENKLWYEFLRDYEIPVHRQRVRGSYILDFYCSKAKLAIELDGGGHYTADQKKHDDARTAELNSKGIEVMRFCNLDIDTNFYEVCSAIDKRIKEKIKA